MKRNSHFPFVLSGVAGGVIVFGGLYLSGKLSNNNPMQRNVEVVDAQQQAPVRVVSLTDEHPETSIDFTYASEVTVNAVVNIVSEIRHSFNRDPLFEYFYGPGGGTSQSSGSGVILSEDGYIVTNNHVINGAESIKVTLNDRRTYDAKVIGRDPSTDIALIKIEAKGLNFIQLGNSDEVKVGEWVLAVGNPFNLNSTVTAGIVSAKARNIHILQPERGSNVMPIESFIQTDAAVNPGNSGGALVNARGELVGINTAIASRTGSYAGYSFAVPVNLMRKVTKDLMDFGEVQRAFLGVQIVDVTQEIADKFNLNTLQGVFVAKVVDGGSAGSAGLASGDVILKIGTVRVNTVAELQEQISRFRPGDKVIVTAMRGNEEVIKEMTLKNAQGTTGVVKTETAKVSGSNTALLGAEFENASVQELRSLRLNHGVKIKSLGPGKLRSAGLKEGFIITHVDKTPVKSPDEVKNRIGSESQSFLIEGVHPNGMRGVYAIGM